MSSTTSETPPVEAIRTLLGDDAANAAEPARASFAVDGILPSAVAYPDSPEQVAALLELAANSGWGVVPWGGGSGIARGMPPTRYDLAVSLSRMGSLIDHDVDNLTLTGEGGLTVAEANRRIAGTRQVLQAAHADAPHSLGGVVAANPVTPKRLLYGEVRDQLLGVRVALPDGRLVRYGRKVLKNVAGYDMNKLFLGSQGMLGVVVETTFKLFSQPDEERCLRAEFPDAASALAAAAEVFASLLIPASILLQPSLSQNSMLQHSGEQDAGGFSLLVSYEGRTQALKRQLDDTRTLAEKHGAHHSETLTEIPSGWRSLADPSLAASRKIPSAGDATLRLRMGMPPACLGAWVARTDALPGLESMRGNLETLADYGSGQWIVQGSLPDGCAGTEESETLAAAIADLRTEVEAQGGYLVPEVAPPEVKRHLSPFGERSGEGKVMRLIQMRFDPAGIMAPGRYLTTAEGGKTLVEGVVAATGSSSTGVISTTKPDTAS